MFLVIATNPDKSGLLYHPDRSGDPDC